MPQMSPYNWLILFFMFNMIYLFILMLNNYNYTPNLDKKNKKLKKNYIWKW